MKSQAGEASGIGSEGGRHSKAGQYFLRSGSEEQHGRVKCLRGKALQVYEFVQFSVHLDLRESILLLRSFMQYGNGLIFQNNFSNKEGSCDCHSQEAPCVLPLWERQKRIPGADLLACLAVWAHLGWITLASGLEWKNGDPRKAAWWGWDGMEESCLTVRDPHGRRSLPASEAMENLQGKESCIKAMPE